MTIAPTSSSSLSIGTATVDRAPPSLAGGPGSWFRRVVDGVGHFPGVADAAEQALIRFRIDTARAASGIRPMRAECHAGGAPMRSPSQQKQRAELGLADPHSVFQHGLEHRLELARRAADDAKHFGGRGLLLERFAQLVEQAGVLDGDDGLGGEVL